MPDPVTNPIVDTPAPENNVTTAPDLTHAAEPVVAPKGGGDQGAPNTPARGSDGKFQPADTGKSDKTAGLPTDVDGFMAHLRSMPVSQMDAILDAINKEIGVSDPAPEPEELTVDPSSFSGDQGPVKYADIEPGMQKAIASVHSHLLSEAVKKSLDSNEALSYNIARLSPKVKDSVVSLVKDRMEQIIGQLGDKFDYDWDRVAQAALAKEWTRIEPFFDRPAKTGFGGAGTDLTSRPLEEPKRVPAYADAEDFGNYIQQRLRYNQQQAERETQIPGM